MVSSRVYICISITVILEYYCGNCACVGVLDCLKSHIIHDYYAEKTQILNNYNNSEKNIGLINQIFYMNNYEISANNSKKQIFNETFERYTFSKIRLTNANSTTLESKMKLLLQIYLNRTEQELDEPNMKVNQMYHQSDSLKKIFDNTTDIANKTTPMNKITKHFNISTVEHNNTVTLALVTPDKKEPKRKYENVTLVLDTNATGSLNEVLDGFIYKDIDDQFLDYPEYEYQDIENKKSLETSSHTDSSLDVEATTEDDIDYGFQYAILPVEAVDLCRISKDKRSFIILERTVGLPLDEENYWDGFLRSGNFKNLKKVELVLELTTAITVIADPENAVATRLNETTFFIRGLNPSKRVNFKVQALPGESFPFVKKVTLNGREICKERRQWKPSLLGPQEKAVVSPLESPNEHGPYYCGRSQIDFTPLVVRGRPTQEGDFPWHVALFIKNLETKNWDYVCGGTIAFGKTIITAAHCVVGKDGVDIPKERILVIAGKYKLYEVDSNQKPLKLKQIIVHENYTHSGNTLTNDIAILITAEYIEYGQYVQPVCQWNKRQSSREVLFQEYGTVVGWGYTENDTLAETLRAAPLRVIPDSVCLKSRPEFFRRYLTENTFCAGNHNGTSACNGDSGGGLVFPIAEADGRTSWYLRGVVSAGARAGGGGCDADHYVVFADVASYEEWIELHAQL